MYFSMANCIQKMIHRKPIHGHAGCFQSMTYDASHRLGLLTMEFASYSLDVYVAYDICFARFSLLICTFPQKIANFPSAFDEDFQRVGFA